MASPRNSAIRATRIKGGSGDGGKAEAAQAPEKIKNPKKPRDVIDHSLARREAILEIKRTGGFHFDGNDTDPYLLRAAKYYGITTDRDCPICTKTKLSELTYVYSRELGHYSGRIHAPSEIPLMATKFGFLRVFTVEVCQGCGWNHVLTSYVLGDGTPRKPLRKPRDLVD
ncbi:MAG: hypothetical protein RIS75_532 [Actinomycetota bacterium]|jgi:hypothetical protein